MSVEKKKTGRKSTYTVEKAELICRRLANGESLKAICSEPEFPSADCFFRWLQRVPGLQDKYARARESQADFYADEIVDLSNKCRIGEKLEETIDDDGKVTVKKVTADMVERTRLQIDARKWFAARVAPKKWGDRVIQDVTIQGEIAERVLAARKRTAGEAEE